MWILPKDLVSLDTFANLKTSLATWLHRSDIESQIPDFITLCEAEFNRRLRIRAMEERVTATLDEEYEALPTDYLEMRALQIAGANGRELTFIPPSDFRLRYRSANTDTPIHYTIIGDTIQFGPAPASSYEMEMLYYKRIPALSESQTTNWMLTNNPDVYLYGALKAAEPFIVNDPRMPMWKSLYDAAVQSVADEDARSKATGPLIQRTRLQRGG